MLSREFTTRRRTAVPFYCRPLSLFVLVWLVMLVSLGFEITNVSYPHFALPIMLFCISLLSFLIGYQLVRGVYWRQLKSFSVARYRLDLTRLRRFNFFLAGGASILLVFNYVEGGLPPFFGFLGFSTQSVNDYGRFKQLMGPLLMSLFVIAFLDTSAWRRFAYALFAFASMLLYAARGGILLMCFQALIVLSLRSSAPKSKIYLVAILSVVLAGIGFGLLGSSRTSDAILFGGMQIKTQYQQWPTIYVWIISYISAALSNLCWFVEQSRFDHVTWTFAYTLLPAFWTFPNPHSVLMESSKIVDGTSTYLANYFLDFSYIGIVIANVFLGIVSGFGSVANHIGRRFLVWSTFLACMGFIFFWDFYATLSTVILFSIHATGQRYFLRETSSRPRKSATGMSRRDLVRRPTPVRIAMRAAR